GVEDLKLEVSCVYIVFFENIFGEVNDWMVMCGNGCIVGWEELVLDEVLIIVMEVFFVWIGELGGLLIGTLYKC
ncbi:hypothetical protein, partial [Bacillus sp. WP8]|uniref:hypothetical protein n=1 Tax=Bacillus sp. WP8 TaxID=756828 RepID=UPI001C9309BF